MESESIETDELDSQYLSMGYSKNPLYHYVDQYDDLMDFDYSDGYSKYAKLFNLKKSDILTIVKVITESAAYQRTSQKENPC